ncbi:MAG: hypothetical protein IPO19_06430 [Rhodoferax sp.]|nr:hypothetical protein [Rhodoferax sp.]
MEAAQAKAAQARAALYPTAGLVMDSSRTNLVNRVEGAPKSESTYGTNSATVSGKQPLYNRPTRSGPRRAAKAWKSRKRNCWRPSKT